MKRVLSRLVFVVSVLVFSSLNAFSQRYPPDKFELSGGFGWPDMGVLKFKYGKNLQIGVSQGFMLDTSVELYYHFAGKPKFTDQRTFYGMAGIEYFYWDLDENLWFPYFRAGKTFNLSRKYGMNLDFGAFYQLVDSDYFPGTGLQPSGSFTFFVRL